MNKYFNIIVSFSTRIATSLCGFIVYGILARNLSSEDFGFFTFTMILIPQLTILCGGGLHLISSKKINIFKKNILKIKLLRSSLINLVLFTSIFLIIYYFTDVLNYLELNKMTSFIISLILVSSFHRIISDYFRATNRFTYFSLFNSIGSGVGLLMWIFFTISIVLLNKETISVSNVFKCYLYSSLFVSIILIILIRNKLILLPKLLKESFSSKFNETKDFLFQGYSLMMINVTAGIINYFPAFFIFYLLSSEETGIFLSAQKIAMLILVPLSIVDISIPQTIAKKFHENNNFLKYILKISFIRFCMAFPIFASVILFSESIIVVVYGSDFLHIESIMKLLSFSLIPAFVFGPTRQLMTFTNNNLKLFFIDLTLIAITLALTIIFKNSINFETFISYYVLINILRFSFYFIFCIYLFRGIQLNH